MTRPDPAGALLAAKARRRPLWRRLLYREHPFRVLTPAESQAVFEAFVCVVRLHPVVLYWVHRLADQQYVVSDFHHRSMHAYAGRELVSVTPDAVGYYRLPGATVGGRGQVAPGVYSIVIGARASDRHYLRVRKCRHGQLDLERVPEPGRDGASFIALERHALDRSKFADEMRTIVERGIEWSYQRGLLAEPDDLGEAERAELIATCTGISPRADSLLERMSRPQRPARREA